MKHKEYRLVYGPDRTLLTPAQWSSIFPSGVTIEMSMIKVQGDTNCPKCSARTDFIESGWISCTRCGERFKWARKSRYMKPVTKKSDAHGDGVRKSKGDSWDDPIRPFIGVADGESLKAFFQQRIPSGPKLDWSQFRHIFVSQLEIHMYMTLLARAVKKNSGLILRGGRVFIKGSTNPLFTDWP